MMKKLLYLMLMGSVFILKAQDASDQSSNEESLTKIDKILKNITVIETFQDKLKKTEPAVLSYTQPGDTSQSTYVLDLAIGYRFFQTQKTTLILNSEWHRNTQIDKVQKKDLYGLTWNMGISNTSSNWWAIDKNTNLKYANDMVKETEGVVFTSYFAPVFAPGSLPEVLKLLRPNDVHPAEAAHEKFAKVLQYSYDVLGGLEHRETVNKVDSLDGGVSSGYLRFRAAIYPASATIGNILECYYDYTHRSDWKSTTFEETRNRTIVKYGVNLKFKIKITDSKDNKIKDAELKIGWEHVDGEDPIAGLEDQEFDKISLKFKF